MTENETLRQIKEIVAKSLEARRRSIERVRSEIELDGKDTISIRILPEQMARIEREWVNNDSSLDYIRRVGAELAAAAIYSFGSRGCAIDLIAKVANEEAKIPKE